MASGPPADGLLEQIMRTYMDMMGVVGTMVNGLGRPPYPPPYRRPFEGRRDQDSRYRDPDFRYGDAVPRGRSAAVRVEVSRAGPIRWRSISKPWSGGLRFGAAAAGVEQRQTGAGKDSLRDRERPLRAGIRSPDKQPEGLYSGAIVDARTGEPCGTLAIQVGRTGPDRVRQRPTKKP